MDLIFDAPTYSFGVLLQLSIWVIFIIIAFTMLKNSRQAVKTRNYTTQPREIRKNLKVLMTLCALWTALDDCNGWIFPQSYSKHWWSYVVCSWSDWLLARFHAVSGSRSQTDRGAAAVEEMAVLQMSGTWSNSLTTDEWVPEYNRLIVTIYGSRSWAKNNMKNISNVTVNVSCYALILHHNKKKSVVNHIALLSGTSHVTGKLYEFLIIWLHLTSAPL